jgi:hypothetical protein
MKTRSEKGAVLFVVLLILTVATAAGLLGSYSSGQELQTAGHVRESAQAQYLAEMGVMTSFDAYVDAQSIVDRDLDGHDSGGGLPGEYEFYLQDLVEDPVRWPVPPMEGTAGPGLPGSLGYVAHQPDYVVNFNDGFLDSSLVPRERINQLRRRVRVSGQASLRHRTSGDVDVDAYMLRTSTNQGVLAAFSVQAELQ